MMKETSRVSNISQWTGDSAISRAYLFLHRHLPMIRGRTRFLLLLSRLLFNNHIVLLNDRGVRMAVNPMDYIGHFICHTGSFEPLSLNLCARLLEKGGTFFDVGANFGLYSLTMAGIPGVRCVAVDPLPHAVVRLVEHLEMNPGIDLKVFGVALSSSSGMLEMSMPHAGNFGTGKILTSGESGGAGLTVRVHSTTFEQLLIASSYSRVNVMKMDVEGHELDALSGVDFSAESAPTHLILEQEPNICDNSQIKSIWTLLQGHGYLPFDVLGTPLEPGVRPVENNVWWTRRREDAVFPS